jgi:hypothetical protein
MLPGVLKPGTENRNPYIFFTTGLHGVITENTVLKSPDESWQAVKTPCNSVVNEFFNIVSLLPKYYTLFR